MKKRLISLFLVFVTLLGILPITTLAAPTLEEAMADVSIYGKYEPLTWLTMNGSVKTQRYTYYRYRSLETGQIKEIPAYCVDPYLQGVPVKVPDGTSIRYGANETITDYKLMGIIGSGYPHQSLGALGLQTVEEGYYATKTAIWIYLLPTWSIDKLGINPALTGADREAAERVLQATKDIYWQGTMWNKMYTPKLTAMADQDKAYPVTINGQPFYQQVFTINSETWAIEPVQLALSEGAPAGTKILDMNNKEITQLVLESQAGITGLAGKCKVVYPASAVEGQTGSAQLNMICVVDQYVVYYAKCLETDQYGNIQDYLLDTDPHMRIKGSAISQFSPDSQSPDGPGSPDEPDPGVTQLKITKLETGTDTPLEGAVFEVLYPDGSPVGSFSTNQNGTITIPLSITGNYTVTEKVPPEFHLLPEQTTQNVKVLHGKRAELTFWNDPYGDLRVEKISDTGEGLKGVTIQIKHIATGETRSDQTGPGGVIQFTGLKPGGWEVRETAGIEGWLADTETVQTVSVVSGQESTVTLTNKELPGLRIIKYDRKSLTTMPDVSFEVFRDNTSLGIFQTDALGELLLTDLPEGSYRIEERHTGDDAHILDPTPQYVELKAGMGIVELVFFNDLLPGIHLIKVDSANFSQPIPNVKFSIRAVDGTFGPKEFTTNEDGEIDLSRLSPGAYEVLELECPGYVIDNAQRIIQLKPNEDAQFVFTNSKLPSLHLVKRSSDGKPLVGVSFRLAKIEDGSYYLDRTTSATGEIMWEGLEPGVYSLREIASLPDHILDPREYHVELFPGKTSEKVLVNSKRPNLTVCKHDADTGEAVPDTVFQVKAADGHSVDEVRTGPDGKAELKNLLPGVYEISEKSVPSPYLNDSQPQLVTLYPDRDHTVYFTNHKRPVIEIIKENAVTFEPLPNVPFRVWYASNNTATGEINDLGVFYTDKNGRIELNGPEMGELGLRDGWFRVQELEPLKGFAKADPDTQEAFVPAGQGHTFRFRNQPLSAICVWKYDSQHPNQAIEGAVFQIRYLSGSTSGTGGTVIGTFRTSANGSFTATGLKRGTYIIEEVSSDGDHVMDTPPQTVYLSGEEQEVIQVYFGNSAKGSLLVKKVDASNGKPLSDVEFMVTTSNGTVVGDANGKFVTDSAGTFTISGIDPNTTLIVKETRAKSGYLLDDTPQTVQIKAGQTVTLEFRNKPLGNLIIHKLSGADKKTPLAGVQFKIAYADGKVVDNGKLSSNGLYWTDAEGRIVLSGITGTIICTEMASIPGYRIDPNTRTQTVVVNPDDTQELYFYNDPICGILIHKVDSVTKKGIYGVSFLLYDSNKNPIGQYSSDDRGYVYIDDVPAAGRYYLRELENEGYVPDTKLKTVYVRPGKTTEITWENTPITGQIQVTKTSADYNSMNGWPAGTPIPGTVFEIYHYRTGNLVDTIRTDKNGVAVSKPLPLGRYKVVESKAADFYGLDKTPIDVEIEHAGQIVKAAMTNKALSTNVSIQKTGYAEVMPGQNIRYTFSDIGNNSTTALTSFYWRDTLPVEAVRLAKITTGTYNAAGSYKIVYKTNLSGADYRVLADSLNTQQNYVLEASPVALRLASNEYVTEVMFVFGVVPANFRQVEAPKIDCTVVSWAKGGSQFVNQADVGGVYNGQWIMATTRWVTKVYAPPTTLPRTGY